MGDTEILLKEELGTTCNTSDDEARSTAVCNNESQVNARPDEGERQISEEIEVHPAHIEGVMES